MQHFLVQKPIYESLRNMRQAKSVECPNQYDKQREPHRQTTQYFFIIKTVG
jgi:hypothetical protein